MTYSITIGWGAISGKSPADGAETVNAQPTVSWDAVETASEYEVQFADSEAGIVGANAIVTPDPSSTFPFEIGHYVTGYWRVRAVNSAGNVRGAWSSIFSVQRVTFLLGDVGPAGGRIFYRDRNHEFDWTYLEAAPAETEWTNVSWGGFDTYIGETGTGRGTGAANTVAIVSALGTNDDYAARLAADLEYNGYTDWFLPSMAELFFMRQNLYLSDIGGFAAVGYWSSSESSNLRAWYQNFTGGLGDTPFKSSSFRVRAVRAF